MKDGFGFFTSGFLQDGELLLFQRNSIHLLSIVLKLDVVGVIIFPVGAFYTVGDFTMVDGEPRHFFYTGCVWSTAPVGTFFTIGPA